MTPHEARGLLAAFATARDAWLKATIADLPATALWLAGSLGRGEGDEWSDLDLLVVDGELPLGDALLTLEVPHNGPIGGRYVGAMYDIGPLPLWVDWYSWPADLPAPRDCRLLSGHGHVVSRTLFESLDYCGRGSQIPHEDPATFTLAMLPLAATFVVRGQTSAAVDMSAMLGAPAHDSVLDGLREILATAPAKASVHSLVARVLDVVAALTLAQ